MTFKALLATQDGKTVSTRVVDMSEQDLMPGDVSIAVDYSTVNYKDALAISGRTDVIKTFPLIPGIDLAGTVEASSYPGITVGDRVVVNSWGLSQTHHGGYAQRARVKGEWVIKLPEVFSTRDAMAIGTAGYTAMLSVLALEHGGITPDRGDIIVTGANGGGAILNVLSIASWINRPALGTYGASKSAAWGLTNSLRHELRAQKTQVIGMHVAFVDTDLTSAIDMPKSSPDVVVRRALDAVEAGAEEVLADELTRQVKQGLSAEPGVYLVTPA